MIVFVGIIIFWLICLYRWDGKCHCDRDQCRTCPYDGVCEWQEDE